MEPPPSPGTAATPDPPKAAAGVAPRAPREVTGVGEDVSLEAVRELIPHGGSHGGDVSPPATCGCSGRTGWGLGTRLGARLGTQGV